MSIAGQPLLIGRELEATFCWWQGRPISRSAYLADVARLVEQLPQRPFAVNLCEDRYPFLVSFGAALVAGQGTLLPPSRAPLAIEAILAQYRGAYCLSDQQGPELDVLRHRVAPHGEADDTREPDVPGIPRAQLAAIVFTSGSTGRARANPKRWDSLVDGARLTARQLGLDELIGANLVSTVPSQHMFGLETSVLLPLTAGIAVHAERPFFPADVRSALMQSSPPRILVSTPLHLDACVRAGLDWPRVELVLSATAELPRSLADALEDAFGARVVEIYGCTESGAIATRETARETEWQLIDGLSLQTSGGRACLSAAHLPGPVMLDDRLGLHGDDRFELLGRHSDLVKIAGKRMSLADLNHTLNAVEGVEDGVFLAPDSEGGGVGVDRLAAFVVAPTLSEDEILGELALRLDPAFLPRPLLKLPALPREATGKIPRAALLSLLRDRGVGA